MIDAIVQEKESEKYAESEIENELKKTNNSR